MVQDDETRTGEPLAHLITEQDVHAFVDGELSPSRRGAVRAFLSRDPVASGRAETDMRAVAALRASKRELYQDAALRGEVEQLLRKRAASRIAECNEERAAASA